MTETRLLEDRNGQSASPPPGRNGHVNGVHPHPDAPPALPSADGGDGGAAPGQDAATGRFLPGNKLGKGNPHFRRLAANRTAFLEAAGPEQVRQLAADLLRRALAGDLDAARLWLSYAIGKPSEAVDPDQQDLDELRLLRASPTLVGLCRECIDLDGEGGLIAAARAVELFASRLATTAEEHHSQTDDFAERREAQEWYERKMAEGGEEAVLDALEDGEEDDEE